MNYVVLGASAAGINAIKVLRELDEKANITLISKDEHIYSRCMLHHIISEHRTLDSLNFVETKFDEKYNISWKKSCTVNNIDIENKEVSILETGEKVKYDKLLIATGASSAMPPIKNLKKAKHVYGLRNIEDAYEIKEKAKDCKKIAILGAGLVGIDALIGLLEYKNLDISVIYREPFILNRQLDEYSASVYENKFKELGVKFFKGASVNEICMDNNENIIGVVLDDENYIECDMAIVATGVIPNAEFINKEFINYDRGIIIDDNCKTTVKDIFAAGDVVGKNAIWPLAVKQGIIAAYNMAGREEKIDDSFVYRNTMNFLGIPTVSLGIVDMEEDCIVNVRKDETGYKKFIIKDNVIKGVIVQGDISYVGALTHLIKNNIEIPDLEKRIFEIGYADFFSVKGNGEFCYNI
ncbi:FAD-dependent oxidoreductase [Paraclostridium bifermentans]|uniref:NAD(P)/FAD-dependent oxidoreductase n=1 Tax=Paraclostridium bifermentans TaxID=1490 RepID=UPI00038CFA7C|nr:FAD-dependent oxidoreductase [Paraclostridium bifermentans]EQK48622.1 glucose inhibited division A family protein [[Clostridium] bifermentans ATCC 19299] [Paraclostridium bifermentans ATCC 19299]MCE9676507.1 FAD-dependent oxidoreductase [Paraclostridium bifermentans]MCR1876800.1 FAD-dependent oxidoreductase [Paraclostridium bifermentans]